MARDDVEWLVQVPASPAEGPVWDDANQVLWWVDIMAGLVHRYCPSGHTNTTFAVGQPVGAVGLRAEGGIVTHLADGLVLLDAEGVVERRVTDLEADDTTTRANDGKPGPDGWFWGGSMAIDGSPGQGSFRRVSPAGRAQTLLTGVSISNGLDWVSPNELYYVDSLAHGLDRLTVDTVAGRVVARERVLDWPESAGLLDGLTLDVDGNLWIAVYGAGAVVQVSPKGEVIGRIDVGAALTTCVAFGGPDLDELYITAAQDGPQPGGLLRCRVGVRGRPAYRFAG